MKIAYAKQSGNMVRLYDQNNREYVRISGELMSYTSEFVITRGSGINGPKHIYNACGRRVRDI